MSALSICSPHCGVSPETTSGGETYERELLTRLGRDGVRLELILARDKPHPAGVPNWTVHRFGIGRGLRWWVAPFVVPPAIERVHRDVGFDLLRVHSLRFIGPAALWARRRSSSTSPSWRITITSTRAAQPADREARDRGRRPRGRRQRVRPAAARRGARRAAPTTWPSRPTASTRSSRRGPARADLAGALRPSRRASRAVLRRAQGPQEPRRPARRVGRASRRRVRMRGSHRRRRPAARRSAPPRASDSASASASPSPATCPRPRRPTTSTSPTCSCSPRRWRDSVWPSARRCRRGLPVVASDRGSIPELVVDGEGGFLSDPARPGAIRRAAPAAPAGDAALRAQARPGQRRAHRGCASAGIAASTAPRRVYEAHASRRGAGGRRERDDEPPGRLARARRSTREPARQVGRRPAGAAHRQAPVRDPSQAPGRPVPGTTGTCRT